MYWLMLAVVKVLILVHNKARRTRKLISALLNQLGCDRLVAEALRDQRSFINTLIKAAVVLSIREVVR